MAGTDNAVKSGHGDFKLSQGTLSLFFKLGL